MLMGPFTLGNFFLFNSFSLEHCLLISMNSNFSHLFFLEFLFIEIVNTSLNSVKALKK